MPIGIYKHKSLSEETKIKIGLGNKGKKLSEENKLKISKSLKNYYSSHSHDFISGKNHPNWRGGISKIKGYKKLKKQRRRALMKGGGELSIKTIQLIYEDNIKKYGTLTCYLCNKTIDFGQDSLDHKIPLFRGGGNNYSNLMIAHKGCNCKKGTKTYEEYMGNSCHIQSRVL